MKELLELYITFFKLGIMNFGGGYAMLPLLERELSDKRGWTTSEELADYYAIGQCTPGAIAVNVSTFIGIKRKGILGGIVATIGFISPAIVIIFIIASLLSGFATNPYVENALAGIRICVFFLVLYSVVKLAKKSLVDWPTRILAILVAILAICVSVVPLFVYVIVAGLFGLFLGMYRDRTKEKMKTQEEKAKKTREEKREAAKRILLPILGFILGLIFGLFAIVSFPFVKKKGYREGVLSSILLWVIFVFGAFVFFVFQTDLVFDLYFRFFRVGICAFGGGLATIPFLSEIGMETGWFSSMDLANMIAISESTPGAMGINMSTYVGYTVLYRMFGNASFSIPGSIISTLGLVTPSILVVFIVSLFLDKFRTNCFVEYVFYGLRAASIGLIVAALYSIMKVSILNQYVDVDGNLISAVSYSFQETLGTIHSLSDFLPILKEFMAMLVNFRALAIGLLFGICIFRFKKHPILYIGAAAIIGILFSLYQEPILI